MIINIPCNERCWGDITLKLENMKKEEQQKRIKDGDFKRLCMRIKFVENYPSNPPLVHLYYQNFEDFNNDDLKFLQKLTEQRALSLSKLEEAMIYQLSLFLEEEYRKLKEIVTFYENMEIEQKEKNSI